MCIALGPQSGLKLSKAISELSSGAFCNSFPYHALALC